VTAADRDGDYSARPVADLVNHLNTHEVTPVGNYTGGALAQLLMAEDAVRMARVVLVSCNAFDNLPPG
jgi:pimeloyl-ACP methyl ester carboxylesterase